MFLRTCGVPENQIYKWLDARERIKASSSSRSPSAALPGVARTNLLQTNSRIWNIAAPARSFIGREELLSTIHRMLTHPSDSRPTALVLHGTAGVGKSQLAQAYAYRHRESYTIAWWVRADDDLSITESLAQLAIALGQSDRTPAEYLIARLADALADTSRWLLIFDNANDSAQLTRFLPAAGGGHILITSLNHAWAGVAETLPIDVLGLPEAIQLLQLRSNDFDSASAAKLAEALGRLPLALEQAAGYANQLTLPLADYLTQFNTRQADLLNKGVPIAYPHTVYAAFSLTIEHLEQHNRPAAQLLEILALLGSDEIPLSQLLSQSAYLPFPLGDAVADPLEKDALAGSLLRLGIVTLRKSIYRIHRLIQVVCLHRLDLMEKDRRIAEALNVMVALLPDPHDPTQWSACASLFPHIQMLISHAQDENIVSDRVATLLTWAGVYVGSRGLNVALSGQLLKEAVTYWERVHREPNPDIASCLIELGNVQRILGRPSDARDAHQQALNTWYAIPDAPRAEVAHCLSNLAHDLHILGRYDQARDLHERALTIWDALGDSADSRIAWTLEHLGVTYRRLGRYSDARGLHERALSTWSTFLSGDQPEIAWTTDSLANDLYCLEQYADALVLDREALEMRKRLYASDHPEIAWSLDRVGTDLRTLGQLDDARIAHEDALAMRRRLFSGSHPDIARSLGSIAQDFRLLNDLESAKRVDEEALRMWRNLYSVDHPDVARSLDALAHDLRRIGSLEEARSLDQDALGMRRRLFRPDHPEVIESLQHLAADLGAQGMQSLADDLLLEVQRLEQRLDGPPS